IEAGSVEPFRLGAVEPSQAATGRPSPRPAGGIDKQRATISRPPSTNRGGGEKHAFTVAFEPVSATQPQIAIAILKERLHGSPAGAALREGPARADSEKRGGSSDPHVRITVARQ